ncbi:MAG: hypothetical protein NZ839_04390, partial [Endomicrobia bacterium]|nr:hypothetical protein [Endomicrobiia bacterium]
LQDRGLQPTSFVIRYTTSVLTGFPASYYFDLPVVKKTKSYHTNAEDVVKLNFGSVKNCPSVALIVGCIYGNNEKVGLLKPQIIVLPEVVPIGETAVVTKGNYTIGFSTGECRTNVLIEKYSIKEKVNSYAVIVKNYYELLFDETLNLKLNQANEKLQNDYRLKPLEFNRTGINNYDKRNTIFGFYIYLADNEDYFKDFNNDGVPDRLLTRDAIIEIPYPASGVDENKLVVCRLNTKGDFWQPVDKQKVEVDKNKKVVRFKTRTFSVYMAAEEGGWASDLSKVEVYPNPFVGSDEEIANGDFDSNEAEYKCLNFVNLTENSKIYIFNLAMELVFKEENVKNNYPTVGKYRWNFKDFNNKDVPSGMYFYLIKDDTLKNNNYAKGRFTLIR